MTVFEPKINGYPLDALNAYMTEYTVGECDYDNGYMLPPKSMMPVKLDGNVGLRPITIEMDFEGETMRDITIKISNLTAMLHKEAELFLPDGFYYTCVYSKASTPKEVAPWIMQVKFSLVGFRHGAMQTETFAESGTIFVDGNYPSSAAFTITPDEGTTEVTVNGITVQNMGGPVVIDGIKKTVMEDGINKFADTNITEFPLLDPGYGSIEIEGNCTVDVSYYPIYL